MESYFMFNLQIGHHSFVRRAKEGSNSKKEEKAVEKIFDPFALDDSAMEKSFMLTAFSA